MPKILRIDGVGNLPLKPIASAIHLLLGKGIDHSHNQEFFPNTIHERLKIIFGKQDHSFMRIGYDDIPVLRTIGYTHLRRYNLTDLGAIVINGPKAIELLQMTQDILPEKTTELFNIITEELEFHRDALNLKYTSEQADYMLVLLSVCLKLLARYEIDSSQSQLNTATNPQLAIQAIEQLMRGKIYDLIVRFTIIRPKPIAISVDPMVRSAIANIIGYMRNISGDLS